MITYDEFMANMGNLQNNKKAAQADVDCLSRELIMLEGIYHLRIVTGDNTADCIHHMELMYKIEDLIAELKVAKRTLDALAENRI